MPKNGKQLIARATSYRLISQYCTTVLQTAPAQKRYTIFERVNMYTKYAHTTHAHIQRVKTQYFIYLLHLYIFGLQN